MSQLNSGAPGLVDRVFAVHAGSRGFDSHRRHMSERFFRSNRPGYPHLSWKIMVSEWRSVIAVSLNLGGGLCLIKPPKLYICTQTHYKHDEDGRTAPDVCVHGSIGERRYENWILTYLNCQITVHLLLFPGKKAIGRTTIQWIVRIL